MVGAKISAINAAMIPPIDIVGTILTVLYLRTSVKTNPIKIAVIKAKRSPTRFWPPKLALITI